MTRRHHEKMYLMVGLTAGLLAANYLDKVLCFAEEFAYPFTKQPHNLLA